MGLAGAGSRARRGPARYPMLAGVARFELQYLDARLAWVTAWPARVRAAAATRRAGAPGARLGEEIVRVFALQS